MIGEYHTAAFANGGIVFTWGRNAFGKLGHSDWWIERKLPTKVENLDGLFIIKIACSDIQDDGGRRRDFFSFPFLLFLHTCRAHVKTNLFMFDMMTFH